jgi:hypothetical protein
VYNLGMLEIKSQIYQPLGVHMIKMSSYGNFMVERLIAKGYEKNTAYRLIAKKMKKLRLRYKELDQPITLWR